MQKIIGLIPARSGSKGIRNKNIFLLNGKPLMAYTIEKAQKSKLDDIYCSSNSDEILKVAKEYGSKILKRPLELATDRASVLPVLQHFRDYLINENIEFDAIQILYPTYPLRDINLINNAIRKFMANPEVSIIGIHESKTNPYLNYDIRDNKLISCLNIDANRYYRRQDYPTAFEICHAVCIVPKDEIDNINNQLYNTKSRVFRIKNLDLVVNIDTIRDMEYAEFLIKENSKWL